VCILGLVGYVPRDPTTGCDCEAIYLLLDEVHMIELTLKGGIPQEVSPEVR
jgi:hypothetical protein